MLPLHKMVNFNMTIPRTPRTLISERRDAYWTTGDSDGPALHIHHTSLPALSPYIIHHSPGQALTSLGDVRAQGRPLHHPVPALLICSPGSRTVCRVHRAFSKKGDHPRAQRAFSKKETIRARSAPLAKMRPSRARAARLYALAKMRPSAYAARL